MKTLLIDVDSTIPNLALMHISAWKKSEGCEVGFNVPDPDEVYASCIFKWNAHKVDGLKYFYPNAKIDIGGGAIDLHKRLPEGVDQMMPDYSIYPECDYDLGFTTRGCNRGCHFCVVPRKEGRFHINQHPSEFHDPKHRKIMLLDNNVLFDKDWFFEVTDWILQNKMAVDFNQGIDIRLMDRDVAKRIAELRPMKIWHFAFDSLDYRDEVLSGIKMLKDAGLDVKNKANWYVYLHNDDAYEDALERCEILWQHRCLPYIMVNRDAPRTQRMTDLKRWTRPHIFFSTDFDQYRGRARYGERTGWRSVPLLCLLPQVRGEDPRGQTLLQRAAPMPGLREEDGGEEGMERQEGRGMIEFYGWSDDTVIAESDDQFRGAEAFDKVRVCEITAPDGSQVCVFGTYCPNNQGNGWGFGIMQAGDEDGAPIPEWARNVRFERNDNPDYSVRMFLDAPDGSKFRWLGEDDD